MDEESRRAMTELLERIQTLIDTEARDLEQIERTLTDGYAEALSLEAERWRIERRIAEVTHGIQRGDVAKKARELASLSKRLHGNESALTRLRGLLAELRRYASGVRLGSPRR
jgi:septal ring factor EnvC (AmiA/AmiB activator)